MKKILSLLFALCVALCASAESIKYEYNNITYMLDPSTYLAEVTYASSSYNSYSGTIEIPQSILGPKDIDYDVVAIGESAFRSCKDLISVSFPNTIDSIADHAFDGCTKLTTIELPRRMFHVGAYAFKGCTSLTNVTFPTSRDFETIADYVFSGCTSLEKIIIPSYVTSVGEYAFQGCTKLADVSLATSIQSIGSHAFEGCSALPEISIPAATATVGSHAFRNCASLSKLKLAEGLTGIGSYAFENCVALSNVELPHSVASIGSYAFSNASGLANIRLSNGLTEIEDYTFNNCTSLTTLTLPAGIISVAEHALSTCSKLKTLIFAEGMTTIPRTYATKAANITLPSTTLEIGERVLEDFTDLDRITLPDGLTTIGSLAFNRCTSLGGIALPASVSSFSADALRDCGSLTTITVDAGNGTYDSRSGCNAVVETATNTLLTGCQKSFIPADVTAIGANAFLRCSGLTAITIPQSVATIGENAFLDCNNLIELTYGEGVTTALRTYAKNMKLVNLPASLSAIADQAFYDCRAISSITLPEGLKAIGKQAFEQCTGLGRITLPASLTSMGENAFLGCDNLINLEYAEGTTTALRTYATKLASVTIPPSCSALDDDIFRGCTELASIYIKNLENWNRLFLDQHSNPFCTDHFLYLNNVQINDLITNFGGTIYQYAFAGVKGLKSATLTGQITSIGREAFAGCTELMSVVVGNKAASVGNQAFARCTSLQSVRLGSGMKQIGNEAFSGCPALNSMHLGGNEEHIGDYAFHGCNSLPEIRIPASVKSIGKGAFKDCYALALANIPEGVTSVEDYTFSECRALDQITIPASVTSIGTSAFSGCASLVTLEIPDAVKSVGQYAYSGCTKMRYAHLGEGIRSIGAHAFGDCGYLLGIYMHATDVPDTDASAFNGADPATINLYVPYESTEAYAAAAPWSSFLTPVDIAGAPVYVTRIVANPDVLVLAPDQDVEDLELTIYPSNATNQNVSWESSDTEVVDIDRRGNIYAVEPGVATLTAKAKDNYGARVKILVIVTEDFLPVSSLQLDEEELTLTEGDEYHLTATVAPADATYKGVNWSSSDEDILTVSSDGLITTIKAGTATVTATTADGTKLVASCDVKVKRPTYSSLAGLGDVDDDGVIDQDDLQAVTDLILGKRGGVDDSFDVNHDGQFTIADVVKVIEAMSMYGVAAPELEMIKLDEHSVEITFGRTGKLSATLFPFNAQENLIWSSSDESVVLLNNNEGDECTFTAVDAGMATITVHSTNDESIKASCVITVNPVVLAFSKAESFLDQLGKTLNLTVTVTPQDVLDKTVTWTSSNPSIATVDEAGVVTAVNWGEAIITATSNEDPRVSASCQITVDPLNGHDYVDLGIKDDNGRTVYWATCNVGANAPEEYGDYFAWGEIEPKTNYSMSNYKWCNGTYKTLTKYNTSSNFGTVDNKKGLENKDDAARQNWGATWRMPTYDEIKKLLTKCTWARTELNSVSGYKVTGANGNWIFLPAAGYCTDAPYSRGSGGYYWSNTLYTSCPDRAYILSTYDQSRPYSYNREVGLSVRPVTY